MTRSKAFVSSTLALLCAATVAAAAGQSSSHIASLQRAQDDVARAASTTKGGPQARLLLEKQRIQGLIDDLEAGRAVDPSEIDRALQRAENPGQ